MRCWRGSFGLTFIVAEGMNRNPEVPPCSVGVRVRGRREGVMLFYHSASRRHPLISGTCGAVPCECVHGGFICRGGGEARQTPAMPTPRYPYLDKTQGRETRSQRVRVGTKASARQGPRRGLAPPVDALGARHLTSELSGRGTRNREGQRSEMLPLRRFRTARETARRLALPRCARSVRIVGHLVIRQPPWAAHGARRFTF